MARRVLSGYSHPSPACDSRSAAARRALPGLQRLLAVLDHHALDPQDPQLALQQGPVDRMVIRHQYPTAQLVGMRSHHRIDDPAEPLAASPAAGPDEESPSRHQRAGPSRVRSTSSGSDPLEPGPLHRSTSCGRDRAPTSARRPAAETIDPPSQPVGIDRVQFGPQPRHRLFQQVVVTEIPPLAACQRREIPVGLLSGMVKQKLAPSPARLLLRLSEPHLAHQLIANGQSRPGTAITTIDIGVELLERGERDASRRSRCGSATVMASC